MAAVPSQLWKSVSWEAPGVPLGAARAPTMLTGLALLASAMATPAGAQSLRPSAASMARQVQAARDHDFTFLRTGSQVRRFADRGYLIRVSPNRNFDFAGVSYPYARPEVALFIERLSRQYRNACGEKLVVTSLTRPRTEQPRHAARNSVHQAGMGLDLRRSRSRQCRRWLESVLLDLERKRVLEASYESRPPHYHLAIFPQPYARYVARIQGQRPETVRVARGDTLWEIAQRHDTSVRALQRENELRGSRIRPGQVLRLPD